MTIDERLEALTMNLELLSRDVEALRGWSREVIAQLAQQSAQTGHQVAQLVAAVSADGENIRALARIAEIHERRLTDLEDGQ